MALAMLFEVTAAWRDAAVRPEVAFNSALEMLMTEAFCFLAYGLSDDVGRLLQHFIDRLDDLGVR